MQVSSLLGCTSASFSCSTYACVQGMYLLLVTNKASNILEDLETLRLLSKVVPDYVTGLDEESVGRGAFELLFAFDEVISLGHKENVTVAQVKQNTEVGPFYHEGVMIRCAVHWSSTIFMLPALERTDCLQMQLVYPAFWKHFLL